MRIHAPKVFIKIVLIAIISIGAAIVEQPHLAYAAPTPENCFAFDSSTGAITSYYDNENNDPGNPACSRDVTIPSTIGGASVTTIGDGAFYNKQLTSVTIPNSVTSIGNYGFRENQLTTVTIPSSVTSIGDVSFYGNQLASVTIPNSVTSIGSLAFYGNQLTSVAIPDSMTSIGDSVFGANQLTSVTIPNSVTSIGDSAFYGNQLASVTIPNSVTSIGSSAFIYNQLASVTVPSSVTSIGDSAFSNNQLSSVTIQGDPTTLGQDILRNNTLESITYNGTTYNASTPNDDSCFVFDDTSGAIIGLKRGDLLNIKNNHQACLGAQITIPTAIQGTTVTDIGDYAFYNNFLTSVTFPDSITSIGSYAFSSNQLTSVTVPTSVTSIGDYAFSDNPLNSITVQGDPATLGQHILYGNTPNLISYNGNTYDSSMPNGDACFIFDAGSGKITGINGADLVTIKNDHTACMSKQINIPATLQGTPVTGIDDYVFSSRKLTSVVIPESVTSIGNGAFSNNLITVIHLPNSVTNIGQGAFGNNRLTSLVIPTSVTSLGNYAFSDNLLTSLTLSNSVTTINDGVFAFNRLTEVHIPASVQSINPTAFAGQNKWGEVADEYGDPSDPAHNIYSNDLSVVQDVLNNMWYTRLYTDDASNPQSLSDGAMSEWWWTGDVNQNGDQHDSIGGHIINPAAVTIRYEDTKGRQLQAPVKYTGVRSTDGSFLTDYSIPPTAIKAPLDPTVPTSDELSTLAAGFAQYYHSGQTKTFNAPTIAKYNTPTAKTVTFTPGDNTLTFVYQARTTQPTIQIHNSSKPVTATPTIPSRPTFSGTATPGATIVVTAHSNPVTCTATADVAGNWTCTLPTSLPAGNHTVFIKVTNPDGSVNTLGPYAVVVKSGSSTTIDNTTPLAPNSGVLSSLRQGSPVTILLLGGLSMALLSLGYLAVKRGRAGPHS